MKSHISTTAGIFPPFIILCALIGFGCLGNDETKVIPIRDYQTGNPPVIDLASHMKGDVEIRRRMMMDTGYEIVYFHNVSGKLRDFHAFYSSEAIYNEASVKWENDTTVNIFLTNTDHNEPGLALTVAGNKNASVLTLPD